MSSSATPLLRTPLNERHRSMGARMVDFGGWELPVAYGSQLEEHYNVRKDAGMFDVSHMCVVDLRGPDVRPFLRGLLANNVDKLKTSGKALYSCMLNSDGGVIDDLIVYYFTERHFRLVVNAATAVGDIDWIVSRITETNSVVSLVPRRQDLVRDGVEALAIIAVQGPAAREKAIQAVPAIKAAEELKPFNSIIVEDGSLGEVMVSRTGYTGEDGFELVVRAGSAAPLWDKLAEAGVRPAGLGARDTLRLEAGMNLYGQDMDAETSPLNAGLGWTVDLESPRDFIGKEALRVGGQTQQCVGLLFEGSTAVARSHRPVTNLQGNVIGEVTSGTFSPSLQVAIAMARIPADIPLGAQLIVEIRNSKVPVKVVRLPFVRNGKPVFQ